MANYYYVKNGGTATGATIDATATNGIANTKLTGTWSATASEYFNSLAAANAAGPVSGDFVFVSDLHSITHATAISFATGVTLISVDDSNRDKYKAGASEADSASYAVNEITSLGIDFTATGYITFGIAGERSDVYDCKIETTASSDNIAITYDGCEAHFYDVDFVFGNTDSHFIIGSGAKAILNNCTITGSNCIYYGSGNGGSNLVAHNCDFSNGGIGSTLIYAGGSSIDDRVEVVLHKCKLPASFNVVGALSIRTVDVRLISCDNGNGYHYFKYVTYFGEIEQDTATYLSATYDGTNGFSALLEPTNATIGNPLRHKLVEIPAQDLQSNKTYTVHFITETALDEEEFWVELEYNDLTDNALGNIKSSRPADILGSTALVDNGSTGWTEALTSPFTYDISVSLAVGTELHATTSTDNGTVTVYVNLAHATADVYVCPDVVIS